MGPIDAQKTLPIGGHARKDRLPCAYGLTCSQRRSWTWVERSSSLMRSALCPTAWDRCNTWSAPSTPTGTPRLASKAGRTITVADLFGVTVPLPLSAITRQSSGHRDPLPRKRARRVRRADLCRDAENQGRGGRACSRIGNARRACGIIRCENTSLCCGGALLMKIVAVDRNHIVLAIAPMIIASSFGLPPRVASIGRAGMAYAVAARYHARQIDIANLT